jgi:hypothetical protein
MLNGSNTANAENTSDTWEANDSVLDVKFSEHHNREPPVLVHPSENVEILLGGFISFFSG